MGVAFGGLVGLPSGFSREMARLARGRPVIVHANKPHELLSLNHKDYFMMLCSQMSVIEVRC